MVLAAKDADSPNALADGSLPDKVAFVDLLSATGLPVVEVAAFVSPKWVPQMADAGEVFAGITRRPGVRYTALVPNLAGLDRAQLQHPHGCVLYADPPPG
jgi:hydroxymethylglutaryl-CoA lyase